MESRVLVVGAGIAGLTCARELSEAGLQVTVVEKSRGVGGRCATRRVDGVAVDHGLTFFHGTDEAFRAALGRVGRDGVVDGWPRDVRGEGTPCQPSAFRGGDWRLALSDGATAFPKLLASGLDVRLETRLVRVEPVADGWRFVDEDGREDSARDVVITSPTPQTLELLDSWSGAPAEFESIRALLREAGFVAAVTVIALYPSDLPAPEWDMWFPENSAILQLVSHDSVKRRSPVRTTLVLQALPAWSRSRWDRPEAEWTAAMLEEAGRLAGSWAAVPETVQTHRWRYARTGGGGDLMGPLMIELPGGQRLGFAGDSFFPGGGVQAAWRSGREMARRLLER